MQLQSKRAQRALCYQINAQKNVEYAAVREAERTVIREEARERYDEECGYCHSLSLVAEQIRQVIGSFFRSHLT